MSEPKTPAEPTYDTSWRVEEWRGRYLVVRELAPAAGSPMRRREIYGTGKFGAQSTPFETEESAQACADRLNNESTSEEKEA